MINALQMALYDIHKKNTWIFTIHEKAWEHLLFSIFMKKTTQDMPQRCVTVRDLSIPTFGWTFDTMSLDMSHS